MSRAQAQQWKHVEFAGTGNCCSLTITEQDRYVVEKAFTIQTGMSG